MGEVPEDFSLAGKVALVTGGSRGLGRAMVRGFARAGADVVIASRKLDACEALAAEVEATTGRRALAYACHVGRWEELDGLVDAAYARFGRVDVLVNNAGMSPVYPRPVDVSEELYDKVLAVNLKGPFRLTALIGTRMSGRRRRLDHQHQQHGSDPPRAARDPVRGGEGGAQRHDRGVRVRLRPEGARQLHHAGAVPHRHLARVGHAGVRAAGAGASRSAAAATRTRSSVRRSTSPATPRRTPPARSCASTAAAACKRVVEAPAGSSSTPVPTTMPRT